jgi:hypothetical protein
MAASSQTYAVRASDDAARIVETLTQNDGTAIDLTVTNYDNAVYFVAKQRTGPNGTTLQGTATSIRVLGSIDSPDTAAVSVVLDVLGNSYRRGVYDCHWEVEDDSGNYWALPSHGGSTLEILEALK